VPRDRALARGAHPARGACGAHRARGRGRRGSDDARARRRAARGERGVRRGLLRRRRGLRARVPQPRRARRGAARDPPASRARRRRRPRGRGLDARRRAQGMTTTSPAPASTDAPQRARRRTVTRRVMIGLVLLALLALVSVLPEPRTTRDPLAPDSTSADGSRALAQILGRQGVTIHHTTSLPGAVGRAGAGTTLCGTSHDVLWPEHVDELAATRADLVLVDPHWLVDGYAGVIEHTSTWNGALETYPAGCTDPDAQVAGELTWGGSGFASDDPDVTLCFGDEDGAGMAVAAADGRRVTAIATGAPFTNEVLDEGGNAALALRLLGKNPVLVWYNPTTADLRGVTSEPEPGLGDLLPPWFGFVAIQL